MERKNIDVMSYCQKLVFCFFLTFVSIATPVSAAPYHYSSTGSNYEFEELEAREQSEKIEAFLCETVSGLSVSYRDVIDALIVEGFHVYIKGGVVRDLLKTTPSSPKDLDLDYMGDVEGLKRVLDRNNWMYTHLPGSPLVVIGDCQGASIDALLVKGGAQMVENSLEFTINNVFYHCNTRCFLRGSEEGLRDLKSDRLVIAAKDWKKWLGGGKRSSFKIFRFWKMIGKGYLFSEKQTDFFYEETSNMVKANSEGFREELICYLSGHYDTVEDLYSGSIAIMGYDWAQQHVLSLRGAVEQRVRELKATKKKYTFNSVF